MSIVIGCKFNNGVMFASDRQVTSWGNKLEDQVNKAIKIENQPLLLGGVGYLRELQQIFSISKEWFDDFNMRFLNEKLTIDYVNRLTNIFREKEFIPREAIVSGLRGTFLLADPYEIQVIGGDLSVTGNLDYYAIGCGYELVMGHLNVVFKDKNPEEMDKYEIAKILEDCIKIACKDDIYIDDHIDKITIYKKPMDLVEDKDYEIIEKCEYEILGKSKPRGECIKKCKECPHYIRFVYSKKEKILKLISN